MIDWTNANFLPWLVPVPPLIAFGLIVLIFNRSWWLSVITTFVAGLLSWGLATALVLRSTGQMFGDALHGAAFGSRFPWMDLGRTQFEMGILVDSLTVVMLFMVPLAILMIFIYSFGYIYHDPRRERFLGYMALFAGAMLTLVVADNLLLLFIGWEIMGFCSFSLIGFWFEKESAHKAGTKAFMTTRVADVIMLLGIAYLYAEAGTLNFHDIFFDTAFLTELAAKPALLFGGLGISAAGLIGVFLVIGTIGKSAQFPLHVWLPDAMEGPTPVSAMIHAAAMVSAGVYMVIRVFPLLAAGSDPWTGQFSAPLMLMAYVGGFTALLAAIIAVAQNDIKRVLAYSTISQLGFMIAALGIGAYVAATFHLITHGLFKALLFMASGSVIHAMEHGEHHAHEHGHHPKNTFDDGETPFDPQDMRNMGGLFRRIPATSIPFIIGGMALSGLPFVTAGFWSKDEILAEAFHAGIQNGYGPGLWVFITLTLAAFLTAFYTARQLIMTFAGKPRTEAAEGASLGGPTSFISIMMQTPLIILATFSVIAGYIGVAEGFPVFSSIFRGNPFHQFVANTLAVHPPTLEFSYVPVLDSLIVALGGLFVGWWVYMRRPLEAGAEDPTKRGLDKITPALWGWMENKFYFDELYRWVFIKPSFWISDVLVSQVLDRGIIDGILHAVAVVAAWIGELFKRFNRVVIDGVLDGIPMALGVFTKWFRTIQTGNVQQYMLMALLAALVIGLSAAALVIEVSVQVVALIMIVLVVLIVVLSLVGRALGGEAE